MFAVLAYNVIYEILHGEAEAEMLNDRERPLPLLVMLALISFGFTYLIRRPTEKQ